MFLFLLMGTLVGSHNISESHLQGPTFIMEPPTKLEFSNSSGGWLDCTAAGNPQPSIDWFSADGTSVGDVAGIRKVLRNGTLILYPFSAAVYRSDIHNTVYTCVASNAIGRIISRDVQVKAVVTQTLRVDVDVVNAARGCTAILKCVVPPFARDLVRVISWIQEPTFFIYPSLHGDGKFHLLPSGELFIHNVEFSDQFPAYRCRIIHRLSRQVIVSAPAHIRLIENWSIVPPTILERREVVTVEQDEGAALTCIAQACPTPEYKWYFVSRNLERKLLATGPRIKPMGTVLAIEAVTPQDSGTYQCTVSNAGGETSAQVILQVSATLHLEIVPPVQTVHAGGIAEFRCSVTGLNDAYYSVRWYKDGRQINDVSGSMGQILKLNNIRKEDRGMYQCIVQGPEGKTAQAAAELQLGDSAPVLLYSFIEQTLQPGPTVSLKCSASGNPTPQITWALDGFPVQNQGRITIGQYLTTQGDVVGHLNISHVMVEDGGEYSCIAKNRAGANTHSARLNIYGMPYIRLIPKVTAVAGENLQLKCPVAGYPIDEIHWERGGRELPQDLRQKVLNDGTLMIFPVEKEADSGVYTCWARNKQGQTARRSGEVSVIVPPKINPFYIEDNLHIGDRVSLTCSVTKGDLPLTISWHKNGHPLGSSPSAALTITALDQFTSILVIEKLSSEHNGNYSCLVSNAAAEISHSHRLVVNVPPIIEPFSFQDGLSEGMRTRTVCGVSSGDLPLVVSWLKDGRPLTPTLGVNVSALDSYSSLLSISSLDSRHSGEFTCVAGNSAAEVRYTATLQVKVPPRWEVEPNDVSIQRNQHATINCQAAGVPNPTITWKKAINKSGEYEILKNHTHIRLFKNGTLILLHVKEEHEGYYLCQAENGVGQVIGKVVQVKVNSPPYFTLPPRFVSVRKGDTAFLKCDVNGDTPINVVWLHHDGDEVDLSPTSKTSVKQDVTNHGVISELQLRNTQNIDTGTYICRASNMYGEDEQTLQLVVQEPPKSPQDLEAVIVESTRVQIQWQYFPEDTESRFRFIIEYHENNGSWRQLEAKNLRPPFSTVVEELKPATSYSFRIIAIGPAGESLPSPELHVRTKLERPAGPPNNVSIIALSAQELLVTWRPPTFESRNGEILGYNIGYKTIKSDKFNFTNIMGDAEDGGEFILVNLRKFTKFNVVVQAYNEMGAGPLSKTATAQTLESVPNMAPGHVRCATLTPQSLQVSWQPPPVEHRNGRLQGYKLNYETVLTDDLFDHDVLEARKTTALTIVITNLKKFANYSLQVSAFTRVGDGVFSPPIYCRTEEDVPEMPERIKVSVSSAHSLRVTWLPPLRPNGIIINYNLYKRSMDGKQEVDHSRHTVSNKALSYEVVGVQPRIEYQFWVTASTRIGEGQSSKVVSQTASVHVPAKIVSFGGNKLKPWQTSVVFPCEAVGSPKRTWLRNKMILNQSYALNLRILDTGELILSNLQLKDAGDYTCQVYNSLNSDEIVYNLLVQVPPSAPILQIINVTSSSIKINWKVDNNGGARLTAFTLNFRRKHGNLEEVRLSRHLRQYEIKDLLCGTAYEIYLISHNSVGVSPASRLLQLQTKGYAPEKPTSNFIMPNLTSAVLHMYKWPYNECPVSYFTIQYKKIQDSEWTLVPANLGTRRRVYMTGLSPDTKYVLKVEAHNTAGFSVADFLFSTLNRNGIAVATDIRDEGTYPESNLNRNVLIIALVSSISVILIAIIAFIVISKKCCRMSPRNFLENHQSAEYERNKYYSTVTKTKETVPEISEDISPYATFQLRESNTLEQEIALHSLISDKYTFGKTRCSPVLSPPITPRHPYYNIGTLNHQKPKSSSRLHQISPPHL